MTHTSFTIFFEVFAIFRLVLFTKPLRVQYIDILIKLRRVIRSINLESKKIEKQFGISIPQLLVLQYLSDQPDKSASGKEIKSYINLNASTVSGIISRLEAKELIARLPSDADRRVNNITLTAQGSKLLSKSPTTLQEKLSVRLKQLTPDQIGELSRNIDILIQIMDAQDLDASPVITNREFPTNKI